MDIFLLRTSVNVIFPLWVLMETAEKQKIMVQQQQIK